MALAALVVACGRSEPQRASGDTTRVRDTTSAGIEVHLAELTVPLDTSAADSLRIVARARSVLPRHAGELYVSYYRRDRTGADIEFAPVQHPGVVVFDGWYRVRATPDGPAWVLDPRSIPDGHP